MESYPQPQLGHADEMTQQIYKELLYTVHDSRPTTVLGGEESEGGRRESQGEWATSQTNQHNAHAIDQCCMCVILSIDL